MQTIKLDDINTNNISFPKSEFNCFVICEKTVYNEKLLRELIEGSVRELHFYGKYDQAWEMESDNICVEHENDGSKPDNWVVLTSSDELSSFIYWLTDIENQNEAVLLYDDEDLKNYVVKRVEENKKSRKRKQKERIELSCFTNLSKNSGVDPISTLIFAAKKMELAGLAVTDIMSTQSFYDAQIAKEKTLKRRPIKIIYGCTLDFQDGNYYKLLCKNNDGKKEVYRILTTFNTSEDQNKTQNLYNAFNTNRNNLLLGMDCLKNNCFLAAINHETDKVASEIEKFDYIEIAPPKIYRLEYDFSLEMIKDAIRLIIDIAKKQKKPVVATNRVSYVYKGQILVYNALLNNPNPNDDNFDIYQNLLSTDEMKYEFDWLDDDKLVNDIVVNNTHKVAKMCEDFNPYNVEHHFPDIPNAYEAIEKHSIAQMHSIYGQNPDSIITDRLNEELTVIKNNNYAPIYYLASGLCQRAKQEETNYGVRGSIGTTLVGYLLGICECNPLPPHYVCPNCHKVIWDFNYKDGFDMTNKTCDCGYEMKKDGHNLHFEVFMGLNGERVPDIDLNFSEDFIKNIEDYIKEIAPNNKIIKAGCYTTIPYSNAKKMVNDYFGEDEGTIDNSTKKHITETLNDIAIGHNSVTWGNVVVPNGVEIEDYTPLTISNGELCTHNNYYNISDNFYKFDCLDHIDMFAFDALELNGIYLKDVNINDPQIYELLNGEKSYGLLGIPEFGNKWTMELIKKLKPQCFSDLIKISALSHGTNVWSDNQDQLFEHGLSMDDVVASRDDILDRFMEYGIFLKDAYEFMEMVRKGKFNPNDLSKNQNKLLDDNNVPDDFIDVCTRIHYMFPKAHTIAYIINALRFAWLKIYDPKHFYAQWIAYRANLDIIGKTEEEVSNIILTKSLKDADIEKYSEDFEMIEEMKERGIKFIKGGLRYKDAIVEFEQDPTNKNRTIFFTNRKEEIS